MVSLSALYDADQRVRDTTVSQLAEKITVPHPLNNVIYADGVSPCRHAKKHTEFQMCSQEVKAR